MRSLVIEDEAQIGAYLGRCSGSCGGLSTSSDPLSDASKALGNFKYDLAIVDRICRRRRSRYRHGAEPIAEKASCHHADRQGRQGRHDRWLNSGADDYLGKPSSRQEFIARVRAVCGGRLLVRDPVVRERRTSRRHQRGHCGRQQGPPSPPRSLNPRSSLMRRERVVARKSPGPSPVYSFDDEIESNTLEAQVSRLRKKLAELAATSRSEHAGHLAIFSGPAHT